MGEYFFSFLNLNLFYYYKIIILKNEVYKYFKFKNESIKKIILKNEVLYAVHFLKWKIIYNDFEKWTAYKYQI